MQFIEKNSFNVRSVVYSLKKDGSRLEFLIFPMIHVGSTEFYDEISRRLASCDLILAEGEAIKDGIDNSVCTFHVYKAELFTHRLLHHRCEDSIDNTLKRVYTVFAQVFSINQNHFLLRCSAVDTHPHLRQRKVIPTQSLPMT